MIERVVSPKAVGKERRGKVLMFTGCSTVIRSNVRHPQSKPVPWDDDKRWSCGLYVWADVENEYGLRRNMGLLLPVKVLDSVLAKMHLPLMSENGMHKHWDKVDEDGDALSEGKKCSQINVLNACINRLLVLQALNRHGYDVLWRCDDENGRVIYDLKISDGDKVL